MGSLHSYSYGDQRNLANDYRTNTAQLTFIATFNAQIMHWHISVINLAEENVARLFTGCGVKVHTP